MNSLKAKIVSISITIASTATLIGFGISSFAWFSTNKETVTTGLNITSGIKQQVDIFGNDFSIIYYDVITDEAKQDKNNFALTPYNVFVPARNKYNRKFIRMTLQYAVKVDPGDKLSLTINCLGDLYRTEEGRAIENSVISNLIKFRFYDNASGLIPALGEDAPESEIKATYEACCSAFDTIEDEYSFVELSLDGTSASKIKSLDLVVDMPSLEDEKPNYVSDFFMEFDYDADLVEFFKERGGVDFNLSYFEHGDGIKFNEDITDIVVGIAGK